MAGMLRSSRNRQRWARECSWGCCRGYVRPKDYRVRDKRDALKREDRANGVG